MKFEAALTFSLLMAIGFTISACSLPEVDVPEGYIVEGRSQEGKKVEDLSYQEKLAAQDELIRRQKEVIESQRREMLELQRQRELQQKLRRYEKQDESEEEGENYE